MLVPWRAGKRKTSFSSVRLRLLADTEHSVAERRCAAHGTSAAGRQLAVFFTIRGSHIRITSARDMSRKERRDYGKIKRPSNAKPKIALTSIPRFENEDEERTFWATAETGDYFDMTKAQWVVFPKLRRTSATCRTSRYSRCTWRTVCAKSGASRMQPVRECRSAP